MRNPRGRLPFADDREGLLVPLALLSSSTALSFCVLELYACYNNDVNDGPWSENTNGGLGLVVVDILNDLSHHKAIYSTSTCSRMYALNHLGPNRQLLRRMTVQILALPPRPMVYSPLHTHIS